jgi:hypothetical protein
MLLCSQFKQKTKINQGIRTMTHNQYPTTPEKETFAHQEVVQFNDGEMALEFRTKGDKTPLGFGSIHKYASNFLFGVDMAIIKTRSGNTYGIARGLVVNKNANGAYDLQDETIDVTVGEPCVIPGVGTTTDVESVMLRYKVSAPGDSFADHQVDAPSPFKALEAQVEAINAARPQQA